jgi:spore maturation protein CgeB
MKAVLFYHSIASCWNHGNAHFLRGVARELIRLGHEVVVYEPADGWSRTNAIADGGAAILAEVALFVPGVTVRTYDHHLDLDAATDGADLVLVHEWNTPALVAAIGRQRLAGAAFSLLFHDTHHRALTAPAEMESFDLDGYDGALVFGEALRQTYLRRDWAARVFTWHEAADIPLFRPFADEGKDADLVWIGNWGDGERSRELEAHLINPIGRLRLRARVHGVRYPANVLEMLARRGIAHAGWLPNHCVPATFARARATVHVPRRPYVEALPGIPTIRVFEALACGIPLVCAPWPDDEGLFPAGSYLTAQDEDETTAALRLVLQDHDLARDLATTGLRTIEARHTCAHRVRELLAIVADLRVVETPAERWNAELATGAT